MTTEATPRTKFCHCCQTHHPVENFSADRTRPDGLRRRCRACDNAYRAARYWSPERVARRMTKRGKATAVMVDRAKDQIARLQRLIDARSLQPQEHA